MTYGVDVPMKICMEGRLGNTRSSGCNGEWTRVSHWRDRIRYLSLYPCQVDGPI